MMEQKKRKINYSKLLGFIVFVCVVVFTLFFILGRGVRSTLGGSYDGYIASTLSSAVLLDENFKEASQAVRGTKVRVQSKKIVDENTKKEYSQIRYDKKNYLIDSSFIVEKLDQVVLEDKMYVRTPATVYQNDKDSSILGFVKKGSEIAVKGFDKLESDGSVHKYKIEYDGKDGYVYGKYMVNSSELALLNYDQDDSYQVHLSRGNTQGGGAGGELDFYPYEKAHFDSNVMPDEVRAFYLNSAVVGQVEEYIELARQSNINAFVVDIKDNTSPGYESNVMKRLSPTNYEHAHYSLDSYKSSIKKLRDAGFYVIGRITVFKDSYYVTDHPESAIGDTSTGGPFNHNGSWWPSAFRRDVWEFNVELAKEAVKEMGFHEIQFDYVRFPDRTYYLEQDGQMDMKNAYGETKSQAIQAFLMYACDELHALGVYVSADVFGESAHNYVTGYGQYWGAISNVVDVISAMPYPDHFGAYEYGFENVVWTVPYELMKFWGSNYAAKRQSEIPTPAKVRTWIQAYDTIRSPYIVYDDAKISDQIRGLYEAGLDGGYMTWNSGSSLQKYTEIAPAFKKEY